MNSKQYVKLGEAYSKGLNKGLYGKEYNDTIAGRTEQLHKQLNELLMQTWMYKFCMWLLNRMVKL